MSVIFSKLLMSVWVSGWSCQLFSMTLLTVFSCHVLFVVRDKRALGHRFVSQKNRRLVKCDDDAYRRISAPIWLCFFLSSAAFALRREQSFCCCVVFFSVVAQSGQSLFTQPFKGLSKGLENTYYSTTLFKFFKKSEDYIWKKGCFLWH